MQRRQARWVVCGFAAAFAGLCCTLLLDKDPAPAPSVAPRLLYIAGFYGSFLLIPLTIGAAILRARLFRVEVALQRTLVYGALTACVVGLYVLVVGGLGALFRTGGNPLIALLVTGLVAALFQPLRARLQRGVSRLLWGERDEPYAVLSRLGRSLAATPAPDAALRAIVGTVREALKLPYAAIALRQGAGSAIAAAAGSPGAEILALPLVHRAETVGELLLSPRTPGEGFGPADRRLLDDVARHAGAAAQTVRLHEQTARLAAELQRSREWLVLAREEERRRLRRDLHDGLGPRLASVTLRLAAAQHLVAGNPEAGALLAGVKGEVGGMVGEIRRLVHGLRPPALDELGLVAAVREHAARHGGLRVTVTAPAPLPPLPAGVEVAAYRIALEALANVARHAQARTCAIRFALDDPPVWLHMEIADDGIGLAGARPAGIGLASMRERAEELGGTFAAGGRPGGGTRVVARLPLPPAVPTGDGTR